MNEPANKTGVFAQKDLKGVVINLQNTGHQNIHFAALNFKFDIHNLLNICIL